MLDNESKEDNKRGEVGWFVYLFTFYVNRMKVFFTFIPQELSAQCLHIFQI